MGMTEKSRLHVQLDTHVDDRTAVGSTPGRRPRRLAGTPVELDRLSGQREDQGKFRVRDLPRGIVPNTRVDSLGVRLDLAGKTTHRGWGQREAAGEALSAQRRVLRVQEIVSEMGFFLAELPFHCIFCGEQACLDTSRQRQLGHLVQDAWRACISAVSTSSRRVDIAVRSICVDSWRHFIGGKQGPRDRPWAWMCCVGADAFCGQFAVMDDLYDRFRAFVGGVDPDDWFTQTMFGQMDGELVRLGGSSDVVLLSHGVDARAGRTPVALAGPETRLARGERLRRAVLAAAAAAASCTARRRERRGEDGNGGDSTQGTSPERWVQLRRAAVLGGLGLSGEPLGGPAGGLCERGGAHLVGGLLRESAGGPSPREPVGADEGRPAARMLRRPCGRSVGGCLLVKNVRCQRQCVAAPPVMAESCATPGRALGVGRAGAVGLIGRRGASAGEGAAIAEGVSRCADEVAIAAARGPRLLRTECALAAGAGHADEGAAGEPEPLEPDGLWPASWDDETQGAVLATCEKDDDEIAPSSDIPGKDPFWTWCRKNAGCHFLGRTFHLEDIDAAEVLCRTGG
ncbi:unnamed protein product [Prorocentrum cordatum]|uniref:Uncharacterized protein n=1 Tax=Prorocentrum cordatum TaxID=2364126 RepID=A0ABN9V628_9DINO|nr:unnamed protein product [Polarella glacialis]